MRERLNLRHLKAFSEIARTGSISAASVAVHLSQPAVTKALSKLEAILSAPLFLRSSSGMFLTEPGKTFLFRTERALAFIDLGVRDAAARHARRGAGEPFAHLLTSSQLRALLAVAETQNFSLAARHVGVSQPSLHRMARDLERASGIALYIKTPQGITLTPAAEILTRHARLAFAELEQGFEEVDGWRGVDTARLAIGSLPLPRSFVLPRAIRDLTAERPNVEISVIDGPYDDLLRALRNSEIDFLIGALRSPPPIDDVVEQPLFMDHLAIVARVGHPLSQSTGISTTDLADYPWVVPAPGAPTRAQFEKFFEMNGAPAPKQIVESNSLVLIRGLLLESDRLTMMSARQIRFELQQNALQILPVELEATARAIGLTTRRDWEPTATQSRFIDLLKRAGDARYDE